MKRRGTEMVILTAVLAVLVCLCTNGRAYGQPGPSGGTGEEGFLRIMRKLESEEAKSPAKPEELYWDRNGNQYGLERYEVKEVPAHMAGMGMEKQISYLGVEGAEGIPESISVREEASGVSARGKLSIRDARVTGEEWRDGFEAPVIFHSYGADGYEAGPVVIEGGDVLAGAVAAQEEILGVMGLMPDEYRILTMEWAGEPYEDEDGQVCRQATARGEKLVRNYEVTYEGEVAYMEPASYEMEMVYRPILPLPVPERDGQPEASMAVSGADPERSLLWYWVRSGFVITVGAGLVGLGVGMIILAAPWLKRRHREKQKRRLPGSRG